MYVCGFFSSEEQNCLEVAARVSCRKVGLCEVR